RPPSTYSPALGTDHPAAGAAEVAPRRSQPERDAEIDDRVAPLIEVFPGAYEVLGAVELGKPIATAVGVGGVVGQAVEARGFALDDFPHLRPPAILHWPTGSLRRGVQLVQREEAVRGVDAERAVPGSGGSGDDGGRGRGDGRLLEACARLADIDRWGNGRDIPGPRVAFSERLADLLVVNLRCLVVARFEDDL